VPRSFLIFVLVALTVVAKLALADSWSDLPAGWAVMKTSHSYPALVERLNQAVEANNMELVTRASATIGVEKALDKKIPGNMVAGVYRPDFAVRMLEASIPAGIEAPIRFYVTENADGTATLSYKTPSSVFAPYSAGSEKLQALAAELDDIFAKIADDATAP